MVALDCLLVQAGLPGLTLALLAIGGSLMQLALVIGLVLMFRRRRRMDGPVAFLIGFEVGGWISLLIYTVLCRQTARSIDGYLGETLAPLLRATGLQRFSTADLVLRVGLAAAYETAPQLAAAVIGGWISEQCWKCWKQAYPQQEETRGMDGGLVLRQRLQK